MIQKTRKVFFPHVLLHRQNKPCHPVQRIAALHTLVTVQRLVPRLFVQIIGGWPCANSAESVLLEISLCESTRILLTTNLRIEAGVVPRIVIEPAFTQIRALRLAVAHRIYHGIHIRWCLSIVKLASIAILAVFYSPPGGGVFMTSDSKLLLGLRGPAHIASLWNMGAWIFSLST